MTSVIIFHISSQNFGILFCIERGPPALKDAGHYFGSTKSIFPEKDEEEATALGSVLLNS